MRVRRVPKDEIFLMCSFCVQLALLIFILTMAGCGGGSEGTGSLNTLSGVVSSVQSQPVAGALITVAETGQTTVTDSEGKFTIETPSEISDVTLAVSADSVDGNVVVNNLPQDPSQVSLEIQVDPTTNSVEAIQVHVRAEVIGDCSRFFENKKVIRQGVRLDDGSICLVKVNARANSRALRNVQVAIQYRPCDGSLPWQTQSLTRTNGDIHAGITQIPFTFYNTPEFCEYRIVAPFEDPRYQSVIISIRTFQKQAFDSAN